MRDEGIEMSAGKERCLGMPVVLIGDNNPNVIGLSNARTTAMVITPGVLIQRIQGSVVLIDILSGIVSQPVEIDQLEKFIMVL